MNMQPEVTLSPSIAKGALRPCSLILWTLSHIYETVFMSPDPMLPATGRVNYFYENTLP